MAFLANAAPLARKASFLHHSKQPTNMYTLMACLVSLSQTAPAVVVVPILASQLMYLRGWNVDVCVHLWHFGIICVPAQQGMLCVLYIILFNIVVIVGWVRDLIGYDSHNLFSIHWHVEQAHSPLAHTLLLKAPRMVYTDRNITHNK